MFGRILGLYERASSTPKAGEDLVNAGATISPKAASFYIKCLHYLDQNGLPDKPF
jgi:hypothetical protein